MTDNERLMEAIRSVTVELANLLDELWEHTAVVGGFAVYLLLPEDPHGRHHRGTGDLDLLVDHAHVRHDSYRSIREILLSKLYQEDVRKAFRWWRTVTVDGQRTEVAVDFLASCYDGTAAERDHQDIDDVMALKTRGAGLAFIGTTSRMVAAEHPDGGRDRVLVHVASAPAVLLLKGLALVRQEDRDAYDICYLVRSYEGGFAQLANDMLPYLGTAAAHDALRAINVKFETVDSVGPLAAAREFVRAEGGDPAVHRRYAYEAVDALLRCMGVR